jgi:uncharacterized protein (TIGR02147 family)
MSASKTSKRPKLVLPSVFAFLDYRDYLRSYYQYQKNGQSGFSFRMFSKQAGLRSPNFYKLVMDGDRDLGPRSIAKFADALGLDGAEREFFGTLVTFEQASNSFERDTALRRILASRRFREKRRADQMFLDYCSNWYHQAIRELVETRGFREDPEWISKRLRPRISRSQASHSLELLRDLGLLEREPLSGRLRRSASKLMPSQDVDVIGAAMLERQMLARAIEASSRTRPSDCELVSLTTPVGPATFAKINELIRKFHGSIIEACASETDTTTVFQLNIQLFPLMRLTSGGRRRQT